MRARRRNFWLVCGCRCAVRSARPAVHVAAAAGIETKLGNYSFRATGITSYPKNGGTLEKAAAMANHASTRTTQLHDRRRDEVTLDDVEKIQV
jgi:integrase/recombinase XerC